MSAIFETIFTSDFYKIIRIQNIDHINEHDDEDFINSFNVTFIQKGSFSFKKETRNFESYRTYAIIDLPKEIINKEYYVHESNECIVISFKEDFYESIADYQCETYKQLLTNTFKKTFHLKINASIESLLQHIIFLINSIQCNQLEIDSLVIDILDWILHESPLDKSCIKLSPELKQNHLPNIENAIRFITKNYAEDIKLIDISHHVNLSIFYFSRIFKKITGISPYKFLLDVRLKNAELLLRKPNSSIIDVAYTCGFNSPEYFSNLFKQQHNIPPSVYQKRYKN